MLEYTNAFSSFSVDDITQAHSFYGETLGLKATLNEMGALTLDVDGSRVFVYPKPDHVPASFTILNFSVKSVEETVDELSAKGVEFERYDGFEQDEKGISRGRGPRIAWFKDPAGNVLSVIQD